MTDENTKGKLQSALVINAWPWCFFFNIIVPVVNYSKTRPIFGLVETVQRCLQPRAFLHNEQEMAPFELIFELIFEGSQ